METITVHGATVRAASPEGQAAEMPLDQFLGKVAPPRTDTGEMLLPDGVVAVRAQGPFTVWIHQTPPRAYSFKWIAADSKVRYGQGTKYRTVKIALPYLVTLAVFGPGEGGVVQLTAANECFFRNSPLNDLGDELLYPALLNCSKFSPPEGKPLAWICTQHLDRKQFVAEQNTNKRLRKAFKCLMHCLLETGFNYSSEHHEQSSWYSESTGVDPRVATVEKWQAATEQDPLFAVEVPWLKTGLSVAQVVERVFNNHGARKPAAATTGDLARIVFNHKKA